MSTAGLSPQFTMDISASSMSGGGGGGGGGGRLVPIPIFLPGTPPEVPTLPRTPIIPPISLPGTLGLLLTALLALPILGWREP